MAFTFLNNLQTEAIGMKEGCSLLLHSSVGLNNQDEAQQKTFLALFAVIVFISISDDIMYTTVTSPCHQHY